MEELTPTQIGARLGVSERTVQRWIRSGKLKATLQANGYYLVDLADIDALKPPTLPTNTASALADILNRIERLEQHVTSLEAKITALSSQIHPTPAPIKQALPTSQETQARALKRGRPPTTTPARQPVPAHLPEGTLHIIDVAEELGMKKRSLLGFIQEHKIEHIAIPKRNREWESDRYLTPEQQQEVRDLLGS